MIKKSFFGTGKPGLAYDCLGPPPVDLKKIAAPKTLTLLCPGRLTRGDALNLKAGDAVNAGRKLLPFKAEDVYLIAPLAGVVSAIQPFTGDFGKTCAALHIRTNGEDVRDEEFAGAAASPSLEVANAFLVGIPGDPSPVLNPRPERPIKTIVIQGMDVDPGVATQQFVVKERTQALLQGVSTLKAMHPGTEIVLVVPGKLKKQGAQLGIPMHVVANSYPAASPRMIANDILKRTIPAGKTSADLGIAFIRAEAVMSLGAAFAEKKIPVEKIVTVITKTGARILAKTVIGTPIWFLLESLQEKLYTGDRLIVGGPMTGAAVYDPDHPVTPDMDALVVQDHEDLYLASDAYCINCGECVRACPAHVPVNVLIRFLEAGKYQESEDEYDLDACIECGLCSYVCTSRIPIFQYIRLAKHELKRVQAAEADNG